MGGGSLGEFTTFVGDVLTGGAISAKEAREQAEKDAKEQEKKAEKRLKDEKKLAASEESRVGESARLERERRARKASGTGVTTSPVGLTTVTPGTRKTLLGQ